MKLSDLTAPYTKCRVITYGRDHNTAVEKRVELQQISGYLYRGESKKDSASPALLPLLSLLQRFGNRHGYWPYLLPG